MLLGVPHLLLAVGGRQLNPAVNEDRGCPSVAPHRCPVPSSWARHRGRRGLR